MFIEYQKIVANLNLYRVMHWNMYDIRLKATIIREIDIFVHGTIISVKYPQKTWNLDSYYRNQGACHIPQYQLRKSGRLLRTFVFFAVSSLRQGQRWVSIVFLSRLPVLS